MIIFFNILAENNEERGKCINFDTLTSPELFAGKIAEKRTEVEFRNGFLGILGYYRFLRLISRFIHLTRCSQTLFYLTLALPIKISISK